MAGRRGGDGAADGDFIARSQLIRSRGEPSIAEETPSSSYVAKRDTPGVLRGETQIASYQSKRSCKKIIAFHPDGK